MHKTTEGKKQLNIIVGGCTIPDKTGKIKIPPENSIDTGKIVDEILEGKFREINVYKNSREQEAQMMENPEFKTNKDSRMSETAYKRRNEQRKER